MTEPSQHFLQSIGWTLVHSLWQALLIYILLAVIIRFLPSRFSAIRYGLGVTALVLILASSLLTLFIQYQIPFSTAGETNSLLSIWGVKNVEPAPAHFNTGLLLSIFNWIDAHLFLLVRLWMIGFIICSLRLVSGLSYIAYLRKNAIPVQGEWTRHINQLAITLGIHRTILLAEGPINTPMVIGYLKPLILFPVGLLSGLSTEQLETILLHELSHIRRHDYLINLFQVLTESIFFFNPFVWMISSLVREEREHCCDDMVIAKGINPVIYARTLAQLEGSRSIQLALGMAGGQNQLLNRIKRIMEKSAKKDWGRMRLLPVALLLVGLICASWLSLSPAQKQNSPNVAATPAAVQDTTRKKSKKFERRTITRTDENGEPHVEIFEEFDGEPGDVAFPDFDFTPFPDPPDGMDFAPDFGLTHTPFPDAPGAPDFAFGFDSIPDGQSFHWQTGEDWEKFEKEFTEKFKEQFKDFYDKNQDKLGKIMEELRKANRSDHDWAIDPVLAGKMRLLESQLAQMAPNLQNLKEMQFAMPVLPEGAWQLAEEDLRRANEELSRHEIDMHQLEEHTRRAETEMREHARAMAVMVKEMKEYEAAVMEQLMKDGYLKKGERTGDLHIQDNGDLTINGKKIKETDQQKYRDLHKKYFKKIMPPVHRPPLPPE